jgi:hypothetical protein
MARVNMEIVATSGVEVTEVPEDRALDFQEAYDALAKLPAGRQVNVDFDPADYPVKKDSKVTSEELASKDARLFARQGKAWALRQVPELKFVRKGDVKGNPLRVSFRIYEPRTAEEAATE